MGTQKKHLIFIGQYLGGEFTNIVRFKEIANAEFQIPEEEMNKLMHISLPIGNSILMANDVPQSMGRVNENENRSKIVVTAHSQEEAYKLFVGLSNGGKVEIPIGDSPWGSYFGMFRDKFGIEWMIEYNHRS